MSNSKNDLQKLESEIKGLKKKEGEYLDKIKELYKKINGLSYIEAKKNFKRQYNKIDTELDAIGGGFLNQQFPAKTVRIQYKIWENKINNYILSVEPTVKGSLAEFIDKTIESLNQDIQKIINSLPNTSLGIYLRNKLRISANFKLNEQNLSSFKVRVREKKEDDYVFFGFFKWGTKTIKEEFVDGKDIYRNIEESLEKTRESIKSFEERHQAEFDNIKQFYKKEVLPKVEKEFTNFISKLEERQKEKEVEEEISDEIEEKIKEYNNLKDRLISFESLSKNGEF